MLDINTIKEAFEKHLQYHDSLYFSKERRRGNYYFYNIENKESYLNILNTVRDNASGLDLSSVSMNFKVEKKQLYEYMPLLVQVNERDNFFIFEFSAITGVKLDTYYNKYEALVNNSDPFFSIIIHKETMDMYWGKEMNGRKYPLRFNYFLNKLLLLNDKFREIFIEILGFDAKRRPILKDLIRAIEKAKCCLLPLSIAEIKRMHTKDMLINTYYPNDFNINFNKDDLNAAYIKLILQERLAENEKLQIMNYDSDKLLSFITLIDCYEGPSLNRFLAAHYKEMAKEDGNFRNRDVGMYVNDYINMDIQNGNQPRAFFHSVDRMMRYHDETVMEMQRKAHEQEFAMPLIRKYSVFDRLINSLPEEFRLIDSVEQLYMEGKDQHNCVYSYRTKVQGDHCIIYHWDIEDRHYTIEFGCTRNRYYIIQMKDRFNNNERSEDRRIVEGYLRDINNTDDEHVDKLIDFFNNQLVIE